VTVWIAKSCKEPYRSLEGFFPASLGVFKRCGGSFEEGIPTMLKMFAPAMLAASLLALAPSLATAAPGLQAKPVSEAGIVKVQGRDDVRRREIRRRSFNRGFRAGGRYRNAPRGWRRYDRRPGDWRTRGCIIVGPVWFCP
jgi:hypothetical protein